MPHTIYIFGNLQAFVAALTGIQMIFNPANNTDWAVGGALFGVGPLVTIGLLVSMLHITTKGVWSQKLSLHHVGILLGLYAAMFVPTTNVIVQDIFTGQSQIVDNIPVGVAYPAAIVSQMAYDSATQLGQAFQMTSTTTPATDIAQGVATPLKTMLQLRNMYSFFSKAHPQMTKAEVAFVQQCVYPNAAMNGWTTLINQSPDILATYTTLPYPAGDQANVVYSATLAAGAMGITCTPGGLCSGSCANMAQSLQKAFGMWEGDNSAIKNTCSNALAQATVPGSDTSMPEGSCSGNGFGNMLVSMGAQGMQYIGLLVQGCINNAGMDYGQSISGLPSPGSNVDEYCSITQNSMAQAQIDNAGAADVFLKNMLPLMSVLQFLFIAMAPLAAFVMVMAAEQGAQMFVKYVMFGMWTQSWLPIAAIINDYAQINVQHQFAMMAAAVTSPGSSVDTALMATLSSATSLPAATGNALNLATLPTVIQQLMQVLSNADIMLAMTPVITMIVFTGSYMAMSNLASGVGGEDNVSKNTGEVNPGLTRQEQMSGVDWVGNFTGVGPDGTSGRGSVGHTLDAQTKALSMGVGSQIGSSLEAGVTEAANRVKSAQVALSTRLSENALLSEQATANAGTTKTATIGGAHSDASTDSKDSSVGADHSIKQLRQTAGTVAFNLEASRLGSEPANKNLTHHQLMDLAEKNTKHDIENGQFLKDMADGKYDHWASGAVKDALTGALSGLKIGASNQTSDAVDWGAARKTAEKWQTQEGAKDETSRQDQASNGVAASKSDQLQKGISHDLANLKSAQEAYSIARQVQQKFQAGGTNTVGQQESGIAIMEALSRAGGGGGMKVGARAILGQSPELLKMFLRNLAMQSHGGTPNDEATATAFVQTMQGASNKVKQGDASPEFLHETMQAQIAWGGIQGNIGASATNVGLLQQADQALTQTKGDTAFTKANHQQIAQLGRDGQQAQHAADVADQQAHLLNPQSKPTGEDDAVLAELLQQSPQKVGDRSKIDAKGAANTSDKALLAKLSPQTRAALEAIHASFGLKLATLGANNPNAADGGIAAANAGIAVWNGFKQRVENNTEQMIAKKALTAGAEKALTKAAVKGDETVLKATERTGMSDAQKAGVTELLDGMSAPERAAFGKAVEKLEKTFGDKAVKKLLSGMVAGTAPAVVPGLGDALSAGLEVADVAMNASAALDVAQALEEFVTTPGVGSAAKQVVENYAKNIVETTYKGLRARGLNDIGGL
jgi:hypothetical protein